MPLPLFDAERWRSPAAGSGSDVGADAGGSQVQCVVRRGLSDSDARTPHSSPQAAEECMRTSDPGCFLSPPRVLDERPREQAHARSGGNNLRQREARCSIERAVFRLRALLTTG